MEKFLAKFRGWMITNIDKRTYDINKGIKKSDIHTSHKSYKVHANSFTFDPS